MDFTNGTTPPKNILSSDEDIEILDLIDKELILKLDLIKSNGSAYKKYSEIYSGGVYALRDKNIKENPDWISQSANSFREILYVLQQKETMELKEVLEEYLEKTLTKKEAEKYKQYLNNLYDLFTDVTHHFSKVDNLEQRVYLIDNNLAIKASEIDKDVYFKVVRVYKECLKMLVTTAIEMHQKIDKCIKDGIKSKEKVKVFLNSSNDSKTYFFSKADENWLHWLWTKGLLTDLKKPAKDPDRYSYTMPELGYLERMAIKEPAEVAQIIDSVKISEANFNPEVTDRFLRIIEELPAKQIALLTKKIRDEKWVYLMRKFNKSGYEFEKIIKKLAEENERDAILELAQAIFILKNREVSEEDYLKFSFESPFYVNYLCECGIFDAIADIEDSHLEEALKIVTGTIGDLVKMSQPDETFDYEDVISLYDVNLFTLKIRKERKISYREAEKNLFAVIKVLIERTIQNKQSTTVDVRKYFSYIDNLPTCRTIWRLRLFTLAQRPDIFQSELRESFFKLFDPNIANYYDIEGGAEYKEALRVGFSYLSDKDQRKFVKQVLQMFSDKAKADPEQDWHNRTGWEILSSIYKDLKEDELEKCEEIFGIKCKEEYKPKPAVGKIRSGYVSPKPPADLNDFTIGEIVEKLKDEWRPEKLKEKFKSDDFLNPRDTEGLGEALKDNIQQRTNEYLEEIDKFFDKENIHPHYIYSLLRGIEDMFRNQKPLKFTQIIRLLSLFEAIKNAGEKLPFERENSKEWLADWIVVHKVISDILLYVLQNDKVKKDFAQHRTIIRDIICYLFTIKDSPSREEEDPKYGDLFQITINSVRGRAFEAFVLFTENDGDKLADDTKKAYENILNDTSLAIRFIIGRYLAFFYFRDKAFITKLFPEILPKDNSDKSDIYLATWEGYLSNTLYSELFNALGDYYQYAVTLDPQSYTQRKYVKGLDESLAIHLALAFDHFELSIKDDLFMRFWNNPNTVRHQEFISFIGQSCLTRAQAGDEWLEEHDVDKDKLIAFWEWTLENVSDPKALAGFGFWINPDKEVLDDNIMIEEINKTLEISGGMISWECGLLRRLPILAKKNQDKTLEIISKYLLDSKNNLNPNLRFPLIYREDIIKALEIIYTEGGEEIRLKTATLINLLMEKGSSMFWDLERILKDTEMEE